MVTIIDGTSIAEKIYVGLKERVEKSKVIPALAIIYVGQNKATDSFIAIKKKIGDRIGAHTEVFHFDENVSQREVEKIIGKLASSGEYHGIIVQLPLPQSFGAQTLLNKIPVNLDVDVLSDHALTQRGEGVLHYVPTVPGAIEEIFMEYGITVTHKKIAVVGLGKLVGEPVVSWLKQQGIIPRTFGAHGNLAELKEADIIITGTGVSHLILPDMIKSGVILIDAGTSESAGKLTGDVNPLCKEKSSLYSPVPGGVGPVTVAILFKNLVDAAGI